MGTLCTCTTVRKIAYKWITLFRLQTTVSGSQNKKLTGRFHPAEDSHSRFTRFGK